MKKIIIVFGVSGCGKSTVGELLSKELGVPFYDADDFHPIANIEKMKNGIPLQDEDRTPWLQSLASHLETWQSEKGVVLACSALKESYRKILNSKVKEISWIFLSGSYDLIKNRMQSRAGHFMKSDMLKSQFDALEVPDYGIHIDISKKPEEIIKIVTTR